ncbi:uncharacterized protein LOC128768450 [Synchiropus splendidus]|uniref:uncharacterized protein LOC128768450 n=1 Tax=Synchiropus splendidus TaxID=270530 RepID=UPI00237DA9AC|nr:uncharacterized protein LOC128768450 [Synchiropus splendidus]
MANPVKMLRGNKDKSSHPGKKRWNSRALGRARAMFAYFKDYKSATRGPAVKTTTQQEPRSGSAATTAQGSKKPEPQTSTKTPVQPEVSATASKPRIASNGEREQTPSTSSVVEHLKSSDKAQSSHASDENSSPRDEEQQNSIPPEVNSTTSEGELEGSCTDLCAAAVALKTLQHKSYHLAQENEDLIAHLTHLRLQMDKQQKDSELKYVDALMKQHLFEKALEKEVIKLAKIQSRLAVELEKNARLRASLFQATNELDIQRIQWERERASLLESVKMYQETRRNIRGANEESDSDCLIQSSAEAFSQGTAKDTLQDSALDTNTSSTVVNTEDTKQVPKNMIEDCGEETNTIISDLGINTNLDAENTTTKRTPSLN